MFACLKKAGFGLICTGCSLTRELWATLFGFDFTKHSVADASVPLSFCLLHFNFHHSVKQNLYRNVNNELVRFSFLDRNDKRKKKRMSDKRAIVEARRKNPKHSIDIKRWFSNWEMSKEGNRSIDYRAFVTKGFLFVINVPKRLRRLLDGERVKKRENKVLSSKHLNMHKLYKIFTDANASKKPRIFCIFSFSKILYKITYHFHENNM